MFDFYRTAHYFKHSTLEDQIVVEGMIPQMSLESAIYYLKGLQRLKESGRESKVLLKDYCSFYLAKNLPQQLRIRKSELQDLDKRLLSSVLQRALLYIEGDEQSGTQDLDIIIDFAAEVLADSDIYQLLNYISLKIKNAMAFDTQKVKKIKEFMSQSDPSQQYFCNLINCQLSKHPGDDSQDSLDS